MVSTKSLAGITVKEAAEALAARAALVAMTKKAGLFKKAGPEDWLNAAKNSGIGKSLINAAQPLVSAWKDPDSTEGGMLRGGAIGAGIGGLAGLGLGIKKRYDDPDAQNPLSAALTGALAGGGIGVGVGAIRPYEHNKYISGIRDQAAAGNKGNTPSKGSLTDQFTGAINAAQSSNKPYGWSDFLPHSGVGATVETAGLAPTAMAMRNYLQRQSGKGYSYNAAIKGLAADPVHAAVYADLASRSTPDQKNILRQIMAGRRHMDLNKPGLVDAVNTGRQAMTGEGQELVGKGWRSYLPFLEQDAVRAEEESPHMVWAGALLPAGMAAGNWLNNRFNAPGQ